MYINIWLEDDAKENLEKILDILEDRLKLTICQKDLIPWLVANPEKAATMVVENIKRSP